MPINNLKNWKKSEKYWINRHDAYKDECAALSAYSKPHILNKIQLWEKTLYMALDR
jgi:predicted choloylglycine hydrolase